MSSIFPSFFKAQKRHFFAHFQASKSFQRGLRGQNECHLSMFVLGNISTAFLALSVDGNISIHDKK